jgi:hypothetical protein
MYDYYSQRSKLAYDEDKFISKDFFELTKTLKSPVVQIQIQTEPPTVMAYQSRFGPLTTSTYILIPDFPVEDGTTVAAVLITKDQLNPTIPLSYLNPDKLPPSSFKLAVRPLKKSGPQVGGYEESDGEMMF